jgi:hypothetical protein
MFWSSGKRRHWPRSLQKTHPHWPISKLQLYNHPLHGKRGLIQSHHNRASTICQERQDLFNEISSLRSDLQLNSYPQGVIDSIIGSKDSSHSTKVEIPLGSVYISHVKSVSEKFKRIGNRCNIGMIFKTKHNFRSPLMKTKPERHPQQMAECAYNIPCVCGRNYIGEAGWLPTAQLREHRHNLNRSSSRKIKISPTCLWRMS